MALYTVHRFDNLRIRRLKKQDHKSQGKGGAVATGIAGKGLKSTTVRGKQDEKVAYLLFTATVDTDHGQLQLKALSESIYLSESTCEITGYFPFIVFSYTSIK